MGSNHPTDSRGLRCRAAVGVKMLTQTATTLTRIATTLTRMIFSSVQVSLDAKRCERDDTLVSDQRPYNASLPLRAVLEVRWSHATPFRRNWGGSIQNRRPPKAAWFVTAVLFLKIPPVPLPLSHRIRHPRKASPAVRANGVSVARPFPTLVSTGTIGA